MKSVDIIVATASRGGLENVVNAVCLDLAKKGWRVRVIHALWEGTYWMDESIQFHTLLNGRDHSLEEITIAYKKFLTRNGTPDLILATGYPYLCYVCRLAVFKLLEEGIIEKMPILLSWLHSTVRYFDGVEFSALDSLALADGHLSISQQISNELRDIEEATVIQVYNPVDFESCKNSKIKASGLSHNLLYIGRISDEKRLDLIIKAIANADSSWNLHIVGGTGSELANNLKQLSKELSIESQIFWYGWQEKPWQCVSNMDYYIVASDFEGFSLVAIEALINNLPVIATPVGCIPQIIKPAHNGYLFPIDDAGSLTEILNCIDKGILPHLDGSECSNNISVYEKSKALDDFEQKLSAIVS